MLNKVTATSGTSTKDTSTDGTSSVGRRTEGSVDTRETASLIAAARILLLRESPFFGSLAMRLKPEPGTTSAGTMGVMADATLIYSPDFVSSISLRQLAGCLAHEVMHLAFDVFGRRGTRDPLLFNIAHDYAINPLVLESNLELPKGVLIDEKFKGKSAEEIYELLVKEESSKGRSRSLGSDRNRRNPLGVGASTGCADHIHPDNKRVVDGFDSDGNSSKAMSGDDWKAAVADAATQARLRGTLPAGLDRWIDSLLVPRLNWREILRRTTHQSINRTETSWRVPSRRSYAAGVRLPGWTRTGSDATIALDTSGSINRDELTLFASEAEEIMRVVGANVTLYACDAAIAAESTVSSIHYAKLGGGGGTDFTPVFKRIAEKGNSCQLLVYFTDSYGSYPTTSPHYPVIWCIPERLKTVCKRPPFGTLLFIPT